MDIDFNPGKSIEELPITSPCHAPCPDMEGMKNFDVSQNQRRLFLLDKLREKHGLKRTTQA
ncbi:hypothetical protein [Vibrio sp. SCSIO 43137]|uniref:hypothetical protein n=1 Tax=Vibrio sp. SCSIO 43137 TaxID=3021011 RepID=UPI0023079D4F|nr:hypothetical protein [Vibrio sp. SCSIO 43137]WCE30115.1 hypothetical protein PK654_02115 [Vibrio sp. SCSIO 43137]